MSIRTRTQQHNSGLISVSTDTLHLRPYALFAYICGFDSKTEIFNVERLWKERRDRLIINGVNGTKSWDLCESEIMIDIDEGNFGVQPTDLTLVNIFIE